MGEATKHKRSLSDSDRRMKSSASLLEVQVREMERRSATSDIKLCTTEVPTSLKEVNELEKLLRDQFVIKHALENALGHKPHVLSSSLNDNSIPSQTKELIKDVAVLELEVMYLERHLLSLYRKAFMQQIPSLPLQTSHASLIPLSTSSQSTSDAVSITRQSRYVQSNRMTLSRKSDTGSVNGPTITVSKRPQEKQQGLGRSHSSLLLRSSGSARVSPAEKSLRVLKPCYTSPLTFQEDKQDTRDSGIVSLAEHLGTRVSDHVTLTPNKISEELVRCMGTIYLKLKDHSNFNDSKYNSGTNRGFSSSSPCSSFSSVSAFSSQLVGDTWSPQSKRGTCFTTEFSCIDGIGLVNEKMKDFSGPHNLFYEISSLGEVNQRPQEVEDLLQQYKSLIQRLETVDPKGLMMEEKLAFWINLLNAMIMHAHVEKGISHSNKKRLESIAYEINGQRVNAEMVKCQILGYSKNPPGQWLKLLLYGKAKSKVIEAWQCFSVDHQEPLLHFALCFGSYSDPAVRVYSSKRVYHQLEIAKEEYIRSRICIKKEHCIILPKLVGWFAKDANLNLQGLLEMVESFLPQSLRVILQNFDRGRSRRIIEWMPHNLAFRYLISKEVANFQAI